MQRLWTDLVVLAEDGRTVVSGEDRLLALDEFVRTDGMWGRFFAQEEGQDPDRPDEWGPHAVGEVDWTGFAEAMEEIEEEVL